MAGAAISNSRDMRAISRFEWVWGIRPAPRGEPACDPRGKPQAIHSESLPTANVRFPPITDIGELDEKGSGAAKGSR